MEKDGIDQVRYKVIDTMMTDVYTKIIVDLSYKDYISTYVSITSFQCASITPFSLKTIIFLINSIQVLANSLFIFIERYCTVSRVWEE